SARPSQWRKQESKSGEDDRQAVSQKISFCHSAEKRLSVFFRRLTTFFCKISKIWGDASPVIYTTDPLVRPSVRQFVLPVRPFKYFSSIELMQVNCIRQSGSGNNQSLSTELDLSNKSEAININNRHKLASNPFHSFLRVYWFTSYG